MIVLISYRIVSGQSKIASALAAFGVGLFVVTLLAWISRYSSDQDDYVNAYLQAWLDSEQKTLPDDQFLIDFLKKL
jgi:hypothetical protein